MQAVSLEEKLHEVFSDLQTIEGVKLVDSILTTLQDRMIYPEITVLILNTKFELLYLFEQQKVLLLTVEKGLHLDAACIDEINLINKYKNTIEKTIREIIEADSLNWF